MIKYLVAALCLLVPVAALGQGSKQSAADLPRFTVGTLPTTCTADRDLVLVTDADSAGNCALGSGTALAICGCNSTGTGFESTSGTSTSGTLPVTDDVSMAEGDVDDTKEVRFEVDGLTTGTTRVLTVPDEDIDLHDSQTDHEERYSVFAVRDYGAFPSDDIDDTDAILDAMAACVPAGSGGSIKFEAGYYNLSDTLPDDDIGIDMNSYSGACDWEGASPTNAKTTFYWTGVNGTETAIQWDPDTNAEFTTFSGLQFRGISPSPNSPEVWLKIVGALDKYSRLEYLTFNGPFGTTAIQATSGWVNWHMNHIRCDGLSWCIDAGTEPSASLRSFSLDNFTYDSQHGTEVGGYHGFFRLSCPGLACGLVNVGSLTFSNGRIESPALEAEDLVLWETDMNGGLGWGQYTIFGVAAQASGGAGAGSCTFGITQTAPGTGQSIGINVIGSQLGTDNTMCGDWGSTFEKTGMSGVQILDWKVDMRGGSYQPETGYPAIEVLQDGTGPAFQLYNRSDTESKNLSTRTPSAYLEGDGDYMVSSDPGADDTDLQLEFLTSSFDFLGGDVRIKLPEGQSVSGPDILANTESCVGTSSNGRPCTLGSYKFYGVPSVGKSIVETVSNGTVNGTFEATDATCEPIGASGTEVDNTSYARSGASSYWYTFDASVAAGEGIDCTITVPASGDFDSFGIWMRSNTAVTISTDLELVLLAGASEEAVEPVPVFTNNPGRDVWRWIEIDVSTPCAAGCASIDGFMIRSTSTTPTNLNDDEFGFDNGALWLSSTEDAIGDNLYVDGVFSATSHPAAYGAPTELVEWTDYFINYTGSNEDYVPLTDQSASGLWVELLHANQ